ncbi:hypothetical protein SteCoe_16636 [Stentor coeruleus]|uniref:Uncharacterized protein n=1 Tax=Stentor coeruleus TaxID=5963 RepID=A0A1R2C0S2_9CILI|nr:hypothetical protein SteCoe_16636 [Stentor coeruleus]
MLRRVLMSGVFTRRKKTLSYRLKRKMMRDKDRFSMTKTESPPLNSWVTKPRIYAMLKEVERMRNLNRHTIKYNAKVMSEFYMKADQYSEIASHRFLGDYWEIKQNQEALDEVKKEGKTLPEYLQRNMQAQPNKYEVPDRLGMFAKYQPQMSKFLPQKLADNWAISANMYLLTQKGPEAGEISD